MVPRSSLSLLLCLSMAFVFSACEPPVEEAPPPAKVPVTSEVLETGSFQATLRLLGTVGPAGRVEVRTRRSGILHYPRRFSSGLRTGESVRLGEVLFEVEDEELRAKQDEAEVLARAAEAELERAQRGFDGGFLPEAELKRKEFDAELARQRLDQARAQVARLRHLAPVGGVLKVQEILPGGAEVVANQVMAKLSAEGPLVVEAWAAARDLEVLQTGQRVLCMVSGRGGVLGEGEIREVAAEVDAAGTVRVIIGVERDIAMPPSGEGLEVVVQLEEREDALTVSEGAVIVEGGVARVFVLQTSGSDYEAEMRLVQTGGRSEGRVEILDGLSVGERVAVLGSELLADGLLAVEAAGEEAS